MHLAPCRDAAQELPLFQDGYLKLLLQLWCDRIARIGVDACRDDRDIERDIRVELHNVMVDILKAKLEELIKDVSGCTVKQLCSKFGRTKAYDIVHNRVVREVGKRRAGLGG